MYVFFDVVLYGHLAHFFKSLRSNISPERKNAVVFWLLTMRCSQGTFSIFFVIIYSPVSLLGASTGLDCEEPFWRRKIDNTIIAKTERNSLCQF